MAEPLTKKIDTLPVMDVVAASNDKLLMLDASESVVNMTKLVPMNLLSIHTSSQLAANTVGSSQIKDGAVTNSKLGADAVTSAKIASKTIVAGDIADNTITALQLAAGSVDSSEIADGAVDLAHLATETLNEVKKNLVYIQLYQPEDAIITKSAISYFFVPSYLAGKKVVQVGMGIVATSTGKTVTVQLGTSGTYGSVSAVTTTESTVSKTLPAAGTKIPINVTCTTGTPAPKGLDFWFLVI